ncbi:MAG: YnbE family lipoprotein [Sphingopyxis sp.]|nr:YnbE family lipoprotein [Sphingopyxis sp.]
MLRLTLGRWAAVMIGAAALGGCVQIATPDKPIEINLNINIRQEIALKLDGDAKKLIEQNGDIF